MPGITKFAAEHDWLTPVALPKYAPEINPIDGIWSLINRGPACQPRPGRASTSWPAPSASRSNGSSAAPNSSTAAPLRPA
jgi:hypothetical protein